VYGLAPADGWRAGTAYTVQIAAAVTGPLGPSQPLTWQFTTAVPAVSATEPTDGALGVSVNDATIGIEFSPPPTGVRAALFQMQARPLGAGDDTPFELLSITGFGVTEDGAEVSFAPLGGLQPYTEYRVDIHQAVFGDLAESGYTFGFETAARLADAGDGGTIRGGNGSVELYFPPNALSGGTGEIAITPVAAPAGKPLAGTQSDLTQVGTAYRIDAGAGVLVKPATLSLAYSAEELGALDATRLGIFTYVDQQWQRLGGTPDAAAGKVMTVVEELGTVALFEDLGAAVGSLRIGQVDCQPRAFAPAGTGLRAQTDISFELTDRADVTVRVYGASGRLERIVTQDLPASRGRNAVAWDGRDEDGAIVASGLYVVVVSAGGAQGEKVVAVVR